MNCLNLLRSCIPCAAVLALVGGCETQYPYCEETVTVLDSLDSPTPAGVTAGEVLAVIEGERHMQLEYREPGGGAAHVEIDPGGEGSTELHIELSRQQDGALRWIDAQEVYPTGPGPVAEIAVHCPDRIEIDATLGFATVDGVFAELLDVTVQADIDEYNEVTGPLGVARIRRAFDPDELMGAFEVVSIDPPDPDFVDYELDLQYPLTEHVVEDGGEVGVPRGYVGGGAQYTSGQSVAYGSFYIGTFGGWDVY